MRSAAEIVRKVNVDLGPNRLTTIEVDEQDVRELAACGTAGDALKLLVQRLDPRQADTLARFLEGEGVVIQVRQGQVVRALTRGSPFKGVEPAQRDDITIGLAKSMRGGAPVKVRR
jgi:hypothetical protein